MTRRLALLVAFAFGMLVAPIVLFYFCPGMKVRGVRYY